ncbi:MAG: FAD binding domain-containing protein [Fidelibacterota bacterium]
MTTYYKPNTVKEALNRAQQAPGPAVYFGGGTDIQIHRQQKLIPVHTIIDLCEIPALREIEVLPDKVRIGSMVTLKEINTHDYLQEHYPLLITAARSIATPVIRHTATVGGNLLVQNRCTYYNQSPDWREAIGNCLRDGGASCLVTGGVKNCYARNVSDLAPALIALQAEVVIVNQNETTTIDLQDLYRSDGLAPLQHLEKGAILTQIIFGPKPERWWFRKLRLRKSLDFTSLTLAATRSQDNALRFVINGVSMAPVVIEGAGGSLKLEELYQKARKQCQTVENDLLPMKYRRKMMFLYLQEAYRALTD